MGKAKNYADRSIKKIDYQGLMSNGWVESSDIVFVCKKQALVAKKLYLVG